MPRPSPILTTSQVIAAVEKLDGVGVDRSTLTRWTNTGLIASSVPRPEGVKNRRGWLYNLTDLARVRLIFRLHHREGLSMQRVRVILATLGGDLEDVLKPNTRAVLLVNGPRVVLRRYGQADREIASGQLLLPLREVMRGNAEVAAALAA